MELSGSLRGVTSRSCSPQKQRAKEWHLKVVATGRRDILKRAVQFIAPQSRGASLEGRQIGPEHMTKESCSLDDRGER